MQGAKDLCDDEEPSRQQEKDEVWIIDDEEGPSAAAAAPKTASRTAGPESQETDLYLLDCGCQVASHASLAAKMQQQALRLQQLLKGKQDTAAVAVADAAACLSCSHCSALLSAQDTLKLLGPDTTSRVYSALAGGVKQLVQQGAQALQEEDSPAHAALTVCAELWQEFAALESLLLGAQPPAGQGPAGGKPRRGKKASQQPKQAAKSKAAKKSGSGAWTAGTGYGGSGGSMTKSDKAAMEKHSHIHVADGLWGGCGGAVVCRQGGGCGRLWHH